MATATDHDTALDQLAAITPGCKIGHPGEPGGVDGKTCDKPADFYIDYHCCRPGLEGLGHGHVTICADHLAQWTLHAKQKIESNYKPACLLCHMPMADISAAIWNVTPLNA